RAHEAHVRAALKDLEARKPEASLIEPVFDTDRADRGGHGEDQRLHERRDILERGRVVFLGHGLDVHGDAHAIRSADELSTGEVEPERTDGEIPLGHPWPDLELAQTNR